jgi:glutamate formiminotransferase/formiminotetrahydrofolate cyclodeaminase
MSRGKKAYLQYEALLSDAIGRLGPLREELKALIDADADAYNLVIKAYKAKRENAEGGEAAVEAALKQATSVPLSVAERAAEVGRIAASLVSVSNPNMKSDLTTAGALARAAVEGALANVEINLESLKDEDFAQGVRNRIASVKG